MDHSTETYKVPKIYRAARRIYSTTKIRDLKNIMYKKLQPLKNKHIQYKRIRTPIIYSTRLYRALRKYSIKI